MGYKNCFSWRPKFYIEHASSERPFGVVFMRETMSNQVCIKVRGGADLSGRKIAITAAGYGALSGLPYTPSYNHDEPERHKIGTVTVKLSKSGYCFYFQYSDLWVVIHDIQLVD